MVLAAGSGGEEERAIDYYPETQFWIQTLMFLHFPVHLLKVKDDFLYIFRADLGDCSPLFPFLNRYCYS